MTHSCHLVALAVLLLAPVGASAAEPYEGRWTQEPGWCGNTRRNGDEVPITITRQSVEQFASFCRVQAVRRSGATWRLDTLCRDEGEAANQRIPNRFELRVDGDKLVM